MDSASLRSLIHFYLRLFSDHHYFVRLMVDTEIRFGRHPILLVNELALYTHDPIYTYYILHIMESTLQSDPVFIQLAEILRNLLLRNKIKFTETSFLPLLSIGFSSLEKPLPIPFIVNELIALFIQLWNRTNQGVNQWICYGFSLLGQKGLPINPTARLPSDQSATSQLLSLLEHGKTNELCRICEFTQSLNISLCLCYSDNSVVLSAGEVLSKRLDPFSVIFPIFV